MKNLNYLLVPIFFFLGALSISAQSTVYFFVPTTGNNECALKMNGDSIFQLRGPYKKTLNNSVFKVPYVIYDDAYKKCVFKEEGKVLFVADYRYQNPSTLETQQVLSEIQVNLSEGSVHYIRLSPKGMYNMQFKEITEKDAQKYFKKSSELPDYIQE